MLNGDFLSFCARAMLVTYLLSLSWQQPVSSVAAVEPIRLHKVQGLSVEVTDCAVMTESNTQ